MLYLLFDRIVCQAEENFWVKITPLLIFGFIWLISVIGKAIQSGKDTTEKQEPQSNPKGGQHQPDIEDFITMVKNRYAEAKEQALKAKQQEYSKQTISRPLEPAKASFPRGQNEYERDISSSSSVTAPSISTTAPIYSQIPPEMPERLKTQMVEPKVPQLKTIPVLTEKIPLPTLTEEEAVEMTGIEHQIYEQPVYKTYLPEILEQIANPDGLRKAFIFSEILDKPLTLRD